MVCVYVVDKDGQPLTPMTRCGKVQIMLRQKRARVIKKDPFTINSFKEDKVMEDIVFRRGLVNRSKGRIRIEENMVTLTVPNKWAGVRTEKISVAHIASVEGVTVYHYQRPLAAVLFLMLGIERVIKEALTFESIVGFALLLIIVAGLFLKFKEGALRLTTTAGQTKTVF